MKLPRNYFENLTVAKYREYLKLLPDMHKENTRAFVMLALTFASMSFFGIFAIKPTLSTIVDLKKQLADSTFVHEQLTTKLANLSSLQQKYNLLTADLPLLLDAIPKNAQAPLLMAQVESLSQKANIKVKSFRIFEVQLTTDKKTPPSGSSFGFSLVAEGGYENIMSFVTSLTRFNRIVTIESVSISKEQNQEGNLVLSLRGKQYYKN